MPTFAQLKQAKNLPIIGRGQKKVMVALPVYDKPEVETVVALFNLLFTTRHSHQLATRTSSLISRARSFLAQQAIDQNFDYLLFIDGDMVFPHDAMDKLIDRGVDIVSGLTTTRQPPFLPTIGKFQYDEAGHPIGVGSILNYPDSDLFQVDSVGMAFTLISRKALDTMKAKYGKRGLFQQIPLDNGGDLPEDSSFCWRAKECGLKVHVDTSIGILHKGSQLFGERDYKDFQQSLIADASKKEGQSEGPKPPTT